MLYEADKRNLSLIAAGDALIGHRLSIHNEERFRFVIDRIREADVSFVNLEVLIHSFEGFPAQHSGGNYMAMPPFIAEELKWAGFNLLSRANNHAMDYSHGGMVATSRYLDAQGLAYSGVGENLAKARAPVYLDTPKGRVALLSICSTCPPGSRAGQQRPDIQGRPGVNGLRHKKRYVVPAREIGTLRRIANSIGESDNAEEKPDQCNFLGHEFVSGEKPGAYSEPDESDLQAMVKGIEAARRQADFVFVSIHHHEHDETIEIPSQFVQTFSRKCIDAGAHAVIGHGAHILQGIEIYSGYPILYSLGNFLYQSQTIDYLPAEVYEKHGLDELRSFPADAFDARIQGRALLRDSRWWETVFARCDFEAGKLTTVILHPVELGQHTHRAQHGRAMIARDEKAEQIIQDLKRLSLPFGTKIDFKDEVGVVNL
ncbi:CapA family protein [Pelagibius litoralis]|uniref:CapA family protein n=1 Tax=Pelagibius litoralis TaxID=374515 RepID=A0A967F0X4_9PROT|nr:CapA family protein [Pelagibius litoralis]NIA70967.1 CapA family protein [Pelagibius litoralis]